MAAVPIPSFLLYVQLLLLTGPPKGGEGQRVKGDIVIGAGGLLPFAFCRSHAIKFSSITTRGFRCGKHVYMT